MSALVFGGALLLTSRPSTGPAARNYGGNGNGTAFSDQIWDLIYPSILSAPVEQILPVTWNGREAIVILARALMAVIVLACGAAFKLLLLCHQH